MSTRALVTRVRTEVPAGLAAGFRSRRFLVVALLAIVLPGGLVGSLAVHGLPDGGHEHAVTGGRR